MSLAALRHADGLPSSVSRSEVSRWTVTFERDGELARAAEDRFILTNIEFPVKGQPGDQCRVDVLDLAQS